MWLSQIMLFDLKDIWYYAWLVDYRFCMCGNLTRLPSDIQWCRPQRWYSQVPLHWIRLPPPQRWYSQFHHRGRRLPTLDLGKSGFLHDLFEDVRVALNGNLSLESAELLRIFSCIFERLSSLFILSSFLVQSCISESSIQFWCRALWFDQALLYLPLRYSGRYLPDRQKILQLWCYSEFGIRNSAILNLCSQTVGQYTVAILHVYILCPFLVDWIYKTFVLSRGDVLRKVDRSLRQSLLNFHPASAHELYTFYRIVPSETIIPRA